MTKENREIEVVAPKEVSNTAETLLASAIEKNMSVETIEKLLIMRSTLRAEAAKEAFDDAMADFQGDCPVIEKKKAVKDREGKTLYHYAPIEDIIEQVSPLLKKNGFSYTFNVIQDKESVCVTCTVTHKMGHSQSSQFQVPSTGGTQIMSGAQKTAAGLTFAKRYSLCNALGIMSGDEDTDSPKMKKDDLATEEQWNEITHLRTEIGYTPKDVEDRFLAKYHVPMETMTKVQASGVIAGLKATIAAKV